MVHVLTGLCDGTLDRPDAVCVADRTLSGEALLGAGRAVAADVAGAGVVAIHATPTLETVVAMVGALAAGVTVVPVPPDSGVAERAHLLGDSGAELLLRTGPDALPPSGVPEVPVDVARRSAVAPLRRTRTGSR
ncbi:hypothetical protein GCM10027610_000440 [Dactylosporangium cerinum]